MSWANATKPTSSYTNETKPSLQADYLLKEDAYYILLETGDKIIIIDASGAWANETKPTSSYTNETKPL